MKTQGNFPSQTRNGIPFSDKKAMYSVSNLMSKWRRYDSDDVIANLVDPMCISDIISTYHAKNNDIGNAVFYAGRRQMIRYHAKMNAQKMGGIGANHLGEDDAIGVTIVSLSSEIGENTSIEDSVGKDSISGEIDAKDVCNKIFNTVCDDEREKIVFGLMVKDHTVTCREIAETIGLSQEMANRIRNRIIERCNKRKHILIGE